MKLALGTVQFGCDYGAFNGGGKLDATTVAAILDLAKDAGIQTLDCAAAYGTAETVLGKIELSQTFEIVTKCPSLKDEPDPADALRRSFEASCARLGVERIKGYLLHDAGDLQRPHASAVWDAMMDLRDAGMVERIGVSCYGFEEASTLCATFPITLIQLPANVLTPWYIANRLPEAVEVHARSVFLQGVLLRDPDTLPEKFFRWQATLQDFRDDAERQGLDPLQATLAPLLKSPAIDRVVVGVDGPEQLEQILRAVDALDGAESVFGPYRDVPPDLIDPRLWI